MRGRSADFSPQEGLSSQRVADLKTPNVSAAFLRVKTRAPEMEQERRDDRGRPAVREVIGLETALRVKTRAPPLPLRTRLLKCFHHSRNLFRIEMSMRHHSHMNS